MALIKLDSSATNGKPEIFTTTFSNFLLEKNVEYEVAMISLSMNYSYPNISSTNGNNTVGQGDLTGNYQGTEEGMFVVQLIPGKIKIDINQRFDLANTADAFRALMTRKTTGATIIQTSH